MRLGTRSLLYGAHQFVIHPITVAVAWTKLYGFPLDPRLWIAFVIHDWGYWGKPNMDGPEGESHVEWAANWMGRTLGTPWGDFCKYHSRFYSKRDGRQFSRLCVADKLAPTLEPWWLYIPRVILTGEVKEYMRDADQGKYKGMNIGTGSYRRWHRECMAYMRAWAYEHSDERADTWTPSVDAAK